MTSRSWGRWAKRFDGGQVERASLVRLVVGALLAGGLAGPLVAVPVASAQNELLGSVRAWGDNKDGQTDVPDDLGLVTAVAGGQFYSVALLEDGSVRAWGSNAYGQTDVPDDLGQVTAIAAGEYHSLALLEDGTVRAWGLNENGQADVPDDLGSVTAIAAGGHHSVALLADGTVRAWGLNSHGQTDVPADLEGVTAIAAGTYRSLALLNDGTLREWGNNIDMPADLEGVTAIAAGDLHSLALLEDGTVEAWGDNSDGQATVPDDLEDATAIEGGYFHSVALLEDGSVRVWGSNEYGQIDVPDDLSSVMAVAAGGYHTLAIVEVAGTETVVSSTPNPGVVGEPVQLVATVGSDSGGSTPSGSVRFDVDGATVEECAAVPVNAEGRAVCDVPAAALVPVGEYEVVAAYSGDDGHEASTSAPYVQETVQADTTTRLSAAPIESGPGEEVTLTATVAPVAPGAGAPSGTVTFADGDTVLGEAEIAEPEPGGSTVAFTTSELALGNHELTATYGGDDNFTTSSSDPVSVGVGRITSTTTLTTEPSPATDGDGVSLTATVEAAGDGTDVEATGVVEFFDGTESLGTAELGSPATLTVSDLAPGEHELTAVYSGDDTFAGSTSDVITLTVEEEDELPDTGTGMGTLAAVAGCLLLAGSALVTRLRRT